MTLREQARSDVADWLYQCWKEAGGDTDFVIWAIREGELPLPLLGWLEAKADDIAQAIDPGHRPEVIRARASTIIQAVSVLRGDSE